MRRYPIKLTGPDLSVIELDRSKVRSYEEIQAWIEDQNGADDRRHAAFLERIEPILAAKRQRLMRK